MYKPGLGRWTVHTQAFQPVDDLVDATHGNMHV
jgi:hypothetical protein